MHAMKSMWVLLLVFTSNKTHMDYQ
jgi:hypothetical protein